MNGLALKLFLLGRKLAFRATPVSRRVHLELETDGRHLTFLLHSLAKAGYAVHVTDTPMAFRELMALRHTAPMPFIVGGKARSCGWVISDDASVLETAPEPRKLLIDYRFFERSLDFPRMPYCIHPALQHQGAVEGLSVSMDGVRPVRVGFFGTRDAWFYSSRFQFPMMDRERILDAFLREFKADIWMVDSEPTRWTRRAIAISLDDRGGDRAGKSFLPPGQYLDALCGCDFFLSPPGWCMPLSHSLIEAMACGAIPILNSADFLEPALEDGVNCLTFSDEASMVRAVRNVLEMDGTKIRRMRAAVGAYYRSVLKPGVWLGEIMARTGGTQRILVNAEEISLGIEPQKAG